ncbi:hypothetical protein SAMN04487943_105103 [Gracilibacillus orientalis]|uniref:Uncharacterized protein n=1 Tax=Gracilibacillus orientalis TaxID=334253 RepID=A0A1I4LMF6_9BACI|nr:hypothetical protein SAMN04487943_105103 [Gracilibacillus orientalis]
MPNIIIFWVISALLSYMEIKRLNKRKGMKDKIIFIIMMCLFITLISLHYLDIKLPYIIDMIEFVTKPISEPLGKWLKNFQQPS